eukprot:3109214-Pleurochrysis_carterae.AAC.5
MRCARAERPEGRYRDEELASGEKDEACPRDVPFSCFKIGDIVGGSPVVSVQSEATALARSKQCTTACSTSTSVRRSRAFTYGCICHSQRRFPIRRHEQAGAQLRAAPACAVPDGLGSIPAPTDNSGSAARAGIG